MPPLKPNNILTKNSKKLKCNLIVQPRAALRITKAPPARRPTRTGPEQVYRSDPSGCQPWSYLLVPTYIMILDYTLIRQKLPAALAAGTVVELAQACVWRSCHAGCQAGLPVRRDTHPSWAMIWLPAIVRLAIAHIVRAAPAHMAVANTVAGGDLDYDARPTQAPMAPLIVSMTIMPVCAPVFVAAPVTVATPMPASVFPLGLGLHDVRRRLPLDLRWRNLKGLGGDDGGYGKHRAQPGRHCKRCDFHGASFLVNTLNHQPAKQGEVPAWWISARLSWVAFRCEARGRGP